MNPQPPILYGLPKLHKTNYPLRPVVSYINAPAYKICKYLNDLLKEMFISKFSIKNSLELTKDLQNLNIQNTDKLIFFNVKNLFPSIPIRDLKIILKKLFIHSNIPDPIQCTQIHTPLFRSKLLCLQQ